MIKRGFKQKLILWFWWNLYACVKLPAIAPYWSTVFMFRSIRNQLAEKSHRFSETQLKKKKKRLMALCLWCSGISYLTGSDVFFCASRFLCGVNKKGVNPQAGWIQGRGGRILPTGKWNHKTCYLMVDCSNWRNIGFGQMMRVSFTGKKPLVWELHWKKK